jgi:N-dimethylarginine dimethylaminohydrolase
LALVDIFFKEAGMISSTPATIGGHGWRSRSATHADDVMAGLLWRRCGLRSEFNRISEVTLCLPDDAFVATGEPNDFLFLGWPDPATLKRQALVLGEFYESHGIRVHWVDPVRTCPNFLFQRDLYFMTPEGAVLARPASEQRAGEARSMARFLASLGIPILGTPIGEATFEGADALWLNPGQVLVGIGDRTNRSGAVFLSRLLGNWEVEVLPIDLPTGVQHLLGLVNFIDHDLAAVRAKIAPTALLECLQRSGVRTIQCESGATIADRFGMNFVTIEPGHVVMPAHHPNVRDKLLAAGVHVSEIDISEYLKAAGGIGCLTGILYREEA